MKNLRDAIALTISLSLYAVIATAVVYPAIHLYTELSSKPEPLPPRPSESLDKPDIIDHELVIYKNGVIAESYSVIVNRDGVIVDGAAIVKRYGPSTQP